MPERSFAILRNMPATTGDSPPGRSHGRSLPDLCRATHTHPSLLNAARPMSALAIIGTPRALPVAP
ncbi:hypothetical protein D3C80_2152930 [compost metagenome]